MRSVILRLFEPAPGTGRVGLSGLAEDVRTGEVWPFRDDAELLRVLARAVAAGDGAAGGAPVAGGAAVGGAAVASDAAASGAAGGDGGAGGGAAAGGAGGGGGPSAGPARSPRP